MTEAQVARPEKADVVEEVRAEAETDGEIHAILPMGDDENVWYYLVLWEESYEDQRMMKLRYFQYPKPDSSYMFTFISNGINMRKEDSLPERLVRAFARAKNVQGSDTPRHPLWLDEDDV